MKKMKKISAIIIALFLIPLFVLPVYADDYDDEDYYDEEYYDDEYYDDEDYEDWLKEGITESSGTERNASYPSWWPDDVDSFEPFHNENAPKIVDNADLFSDSEESHLTDLITQSIAKTGADLVIYTDTTNYGLGNQMCAADFYRFNGYGIGDDYNGSVLYINMDPSDRQYYTAATGDCQKYINQDTINDLQDVPYDDMKAGKYESAMEKYINAITGLFTTGKVPESSGDFIIRLIVCIVLGLIVGGITMGVLTSQMKKVQIATKANEYLVRDSVHMRASNDFFLFATVTRTKIPKNNGKGGGSSFSGGFSSHGGGSFSGGGRSF